MGTKLYVNEGHPLFNKEGMFYKEFPSDFRQIRYFTLLIVQKAPPEIKELNLLEQQISEIIKNAVKHGNKNDINKKVKVWYTFTTDRAHLIVEDEGDGFTELEHWNEFNLARVRCFEEQDFEKLGDFVSFRTIQSDDYDGGNAMFAAIEYWNEDVVYNNKKNSVAVGKTFPKKHHGIDL